MAMGSVQQQGRRWQGQERGAAAGAQAARAGAWCSSRGAGMVGGRAEQGRACEG
ncbi:hypothetical protein SLEP1_g15439 [Rubroshorea leprosula]|uniref:Uncharacterized protein n=1 Tax=Rubroshorea leprosula TaxID=152421 RepID=A0AAV5ITD5_9ROSI|nr:hypothetical protein SLEP1_g15439 [Rubroshorea leprosula]